jgi:hypothetical protein
VRARARLLWHRYRTEPAVGTVVATLSTNVTSTASPTLSYTVTLCDTIMCHIAVERKPHIDRVSQVVSKSTQHNQMGSFGKSQISTALFQCEIESHIMCTAVHVQ